MKTIAKLAIGLALLTPSFNAFSQALKHQTEQINSLKPGNYRPVKLVNNVNGGYSYELITETIVLKEVKLDPNFIEHKYFILLEDGKESNYILGDYAFPVTFGKEPFEGNKKLQDKVGLVPREFRVGRTVHVAIIDGMIFDFNWKFDENDSSTFLPQRILIHESFLEGQKEAESEKQNEKLSLQEKMKRKIASASPELSSAIYVNNRFKEKDAAGIAKKYIVDAIQKKKEVESNWKSDSYNNQRLELLKAKRELMNKAIKEYNDDIMDSPEYRAIQENNRIAENAANRKYVKLKNETGSDIYIYAEGSMNGIRLNAGSTNSYDCTKSYYYAFDENAGTRGGNTGQVRAYTGNSSCGGVVSVR